MTEQLPEYQSEMERNKLNLQTVLFRPLRSHQCSSEWFENWDMSTAQRAINTSHTDKQWHILFLNTRVLKLKRASNAYVYLHIYIYIYTDTQVTVLSC